MELPRAPYQQAEQPRRVALLKAEAEADQYLVDQVYVGGGRSANPNCGR